MISWDSDMGRGVELRIHWGVDDRSSGPSDRPFTGNTMRRTARPRRLSNLWRQAMLPCKRWRTALRWRMYCDIGANVPCPEKLGWRSRSRGRNAWAAAPWRPLQAAESRLFAGNPAQASSCTEVFPSFQSAISRPSRATVASLKLKYPQQDRLRWARVASRLSALCALSSQGCLVICWGRMCGASGR